MDKMRKYFQINFFYLIYFILFYFITFILRLAINNIEPHILPLIPKPSSPNDI
jgi:hypothetical protein